MQKSFIAIALALTLTCTFAAYNPSAGYIKAPQTVAGDNESNFTNSAYLQLASVNVGELDLLGTNSTAGATVAINSWTAAYRKLDSKALTASTNSSVAFTGGLSLAQVYYVNGYVVSFAYENDASNNPQISVYQTPVSGGATIPKLTLTSNNYSWWNPKVLQAVTISKTVYVFYTAANTSSTTFQVNVTNFVAGGAKGTQDFNITTAYTTGLGVVWGEALGSSQLFANWIEGGVLKDATIDLSKQTATASIVAGWTVNFTCTVFSTDKKLFGDLCFDAITNPGNTTFYAKTNTNTTLNRLVTNATNTTTWTAVYPYGPYIAITYTDSATTVGRTTLSYDIWNVDSFTPYKNKTAFVTYDKANSSVTFFRVTSGGLYTILSNTAVTNATTGAVNYTSIQVGQVLGSSYLTSVLGFILTIVAGLLLF
jgi:hypothetical protein